MNRKKIVSNIILSFVVALSSAIALPQTSSAAASRLGGKDRYETSAAVSKSGWTTSDYVILASGENYADALCAAPLAKKHDAPILLTGSKTLNSTVKTEINRLKATHVIEIGGKGAISDSIENELKSSMSLNVTRIGGADRYETSAAVAKELGSFDKVVLAFGQGYADALSIAPVAASQGYPILLTSRNAVPKAVSEYITSKKASITKSYIVGGNGVITDSSISSLPAPVRIGGSDRYATNVNVMTYFKSSIKFDKLYVVRGAGPKGNEFADALSASSLAAKTSSPVILTYNTLSKTVEDFIKSNVGSTASIVPVGGSASVPDSLISSLQKVVDEAEDEDEENPSTGGGGGGGSSSDSNSHLISAVNSIKTIKGLNSAQQSVVDGIVSVVDKHSSDADYDYQNDAEAAEVKSEYEALSENDKNALKEAIQSTVSLLDQIALASEFGLL
ncbi:MAG: cell wall-binding repeat-containing protein [Clostridium sp.]|uniref:cell wall-binding repeat-containing protein n=1 Tax=Clostridium sp. TaxID=1506 RepID=UPI0025BF8C09|nr:cell wall-binding repeat-containing protein [Clostridium sp.]MCH3965053.1 cell wall-binding repeat-containing protein [Clostridium sp.]MCI1714274.1 cell wall-binding repeat-containing protein [Clostridium sp.]MCI1798536.1 cell wall-binding repeat-containing protein [Clostridium sp.]MCI1812733.1 cell wall-binding repeat-containing protein [Clostridium sp.]MCI1869345.1 cell wall-binding repeat-containing protein [Clostridium sp.]